MLDSRNTPVSAIMATDVQTLDADATIQEALETLEEYGISGTPVVEDGKCIGVFSTTDLARRAREIGSGESPLAIGWYTLGPLSDRFYSTSEELDAGWAVREVVGDWMNRELKLVTPDTSIQEAAGLMAEEGIHRVLVMEGSKLSGIVSSLDIAAYVAGGGTEDAKATAPKAKRAAPRRKKARAR